MEVNPLPTAAAGGPRISPGGVAVRSVIVLGAVLVVVAAGGTPPVTGIALVVGVMLALARPTVIGAWVALPTAVWAFAAGTGSAVGLGPVLLGAAGVYLVHTGCAAAAVVPWSARLSAGAVRRWLLRCLPAVVLTVALALVDATLGITPRNSLFAVAAAAAAIGGAAALYRLLADAGSPTE